MTLDVCLMLVILFCLAMVVVSVLKERASLQSAPAPARVAKAPVEGGEEHHADFPLPDLSELSQRDRILMWATQMPALRFVSDREPHGAYYTPLKLVYIGLAREYPEIYDGRTFQEWVEFLVRNGLFRFEDDAIHITRGGVELLELLNAATLASKG